MSIDRTLLAVTATVWITIILSQRASAEASLGSQEQRFSLSEADYLDCVYPRLIAPQTSNRQIQKHFQPPSAEACPAIERRFGKAIPNTKAESASLRFPRFSDTWRAERATRAFALREFSIHGPVFAPPGRDFLSQVSIENAEIEKKLRKNLRISSEGTYEGILPKGHCKQVASDLHLASAMQNRYSQADWHERLLRTGYDCTALAYRETSAELNSASGHPKAQSAYENLANGWSVDDEAELGAKIRGQAFVLVPQLGYDIPSDPISGPKEKLNFVYMKEAFEKHGARLHLVERTTVEDMTLQVDTSLKNLDLILSEEARIQKRNPKVYFLARSMGGLVLRLMLERRPELQKNAMGILLLGATPWGSAVAEFKSRMDQFDEVYVGLSNPLSILVGSVAGAFNKALPQLLKGAGRRLNIRSMSHRNYLPKAEQSISSPVLNVILLPPSQRDYFNGSSRIAGVDQTFLLMSMYGPTEGSSPLAHASLDTAKSLRLIDGRLNHLAFWELEKPKAMELWWASLLTSFRSGLFFRTGR